MNAISKSLPDIVREATCVLLDIEGTTTSINFVRKELFTYGVSHVSNFVKSNWNTPEVQEFVKELSNQGKTVMSTDDSLNATDFHEKELTQEDIINCLQNQMNRGEKNLRLKELQGVIWRNGYISGDLVGHVYPDVVSALKLWKNKGKNIFTYSTGSVTAQHLLFKYSNHGNLKKYINKYFDTNIGSKLDPTSYIKICEEIEKFPNEFVFFSDHPQELFAAKQVGMNVALIVRDPENPMFLQERSYLRPDDHIISSFSEAM